MLEHAVDVRREIVIGAAVDEVWKVVADGARQAEWFPGMVSSQVDDGIRTIVTAVGGFLMEEILEVDHEARCFEYRITGPDSRTNWRVKKYPSIGNSTSYKVQGPDGTKNYRIKNNHNESFCNYLPTHYSPDASSSSKTSSPLGTPRTTESMEIRA
jgi:hypothetical protein